MLVGSGRLATHLQHWNSLLSRPNAIYTWNRTQSPQLLSEYLEKSSLVWLAISDSAIIPFFEKHLQSKAVVHFSGALHDSRLASAHPLMSFTKNLFHPELYNKIHFTLNGAANLENVLPGFENKFTAITSDNKAYYHALCVLAGNFPQMIWSRISDHMKNLNLPPEALDLYIDQITRNYLDLKDAALTGPLVRKDRQTIEQNILSLNRDMKLKTVYSTIVREFTV